MSVKKESFQPGQGHFKISSLLGLSHQANLKVERAKARPKRLQQRQGYMSAKS
jgi:hypothetical protein